MNQASALSGAWLAGSGAPAQGRTDRQIWGREGILPPRQIGRDLVGVSLAFLCSCGCGSLV